jgi:hypothetical protein
LVAQFGMGPVMDGMGLIHPVGSYNGSAMIAFTSCREMLPDPERYEECLRDSLDELTSAALGRAPNPAPAALAAAT